MSRPVVTVIAVILLVGLVGSGVLGLWLVVTKDRVGILSYRVQLGEDVSLRGIVEKEEELIKSDRVLKQVIANLGLIDEWGMDSEEEALVHMRSKLILKEDRLSAGVRVLYRDRKQDRALRILQEIKEIFGPVRLEAVGRNELPPLVPETVQGSEDRFRQVPLPAGP